MGNNGSEIFDAGHNVDAFLHMEVLKVRGMNVDGSLKRLFEYNWGCVASALFVGMGQLFTYASHHRPFL